MQNIGLFWLFYALVGILFTGLNIVVAYQKYEVWGYIPILTILYVVLNPNPKTGAVAKKMKSPSCS